MDHSKFEQDKTSDAVLVEADSELQNTPNTDVLNNQSVKQRHSFEFSSDDVDVPSGVK